MKMKTLFLLVVFVTATPFIFALPREAGSRFEKFLDTLGGGRTKVLEDAKESLKDLVIEGDIRVTRGLLERAEGNAKRGVVTNAAWKWPTTQENGKTIAKIPYKSGLSGQASNELTRSIAEMTDRTCVRFVPRSGESNYVNFDPGSSSSPCSSDIGKLGGEQYVTISDGCEYKGKILHEMMHVLGFYHEQSRPDRDNYVRYNSGNVKSGYEGQFDVQSQDTQGLAYDLHSMMHYRKDQFSSGGNTLEAIANSNIQLGNKNDFSATDIKRINKLFGCSEVNDNYRDYYVTVSTAPNSFWHLFTGTDEYVYIQLIGSSKTSRWCDVATGGAVDNFESESTENFFVACDDVGTIQKLKVKLVNNPNESGDDGWTLKEVVIKDKISSSQMKKYVFDADLADLNEGDSVTLSPSVSTVSLDTGIW